MSRGRMRVGDVVRQHKTYWGTPPELKDRGIIQWRDGRGVWREFGPKPTADDPVCIIRIGAGLYRYTDSLSEEWRRVPLAEQTAEERIRSAWYRWAYTKQRHQPPGQTLAWYLMLAFLPAAQQAQVLSWSKIPSFERLALWVARFVDPEDRLIWPRIGEAIAKWEPPEEPEPDWADYETLEWSVWFAFLPRSVENSFLVGSTPDYLQLAVVAGIEAEAQHRRLQILQHALGRLPA